MSSLDPSIMCRKLLFQVLLFAMLCHGLMAKAHQGSQVKRSSPPVTIQNYNIQGPVQLTQGNSEIAAPEYKANHQPPQPHHSHYSHQPHQSHQPYSAVVSYPDSRYPDLRVPAYVVTAYKAELKHHEQQKQTPPVAPNSKPQIPYYVMPYYNHQQPYAPVYSAPVAYQPTAQHVGPYQHVPVYQTIHQTPVYVPQHRVLPAANGSQFVAPVYQHQVVPPYFAYPNNDTEADVNKQNDENSEFVIHHAIAISKMEEKFPEEQVPQTGHAPSVDEEQVEMHHELGPAEKAPTMEPVPSAENPNGAPSSHVKADDSVEVPSEPSDPVADEQSLGKQKEVTADGTADSLKEMMEAESHKAMMDTELQAQEELVTTMQPEMEAVVTTEMPMMEEEGTEDTLIVMQEPLADVIESTTELVEPVTEGTIQEAVNEEEQIVSEQPAIVPLIYREKVEKKTDTAALRPLPVPLIYRAEPQVKIQQPQQPAVTVLYRQQVTRKQPTEALPSKVAQVLSAVRDDSKVASGVTHVRIVQEARSRAAKQPEQPMPNDAHEKGTETMPGDRKEMGMTQNHQKDTAMEDDQIEMTPEPTTQSTTSTTKRSKYTAVQATTTTSTPLLSVRTKPIYWKYWKQSTVQKATPFEEEPQIMGHFDVMESGEEVDDYSDEEYTLPVHQIRTKKRAKTQARTPYQRPYPIVANRPMQRTPSKAYRPSKSGARKDGNKRVETRLQKVHEESYDSPESDEARNESGSSCELLSKIKAALIHGDERNLPPGVAIDRKKQRAILAEGFALYYFGDEMEEEAFH